MATSMLGGDDDQIVEKGQLIGQPKKHDQQQAAHLDKVTDYVEEQEISGDIGKVSLIWFSIYIYIYTVHTTLLNIHFEEVVFSILSYQFSYLSGSFSDWWATNERKRRKG